MPSDSGHSAPAVDPVAVTSDKSCILAAEKVDDDDDDDGAELSCGGVPCDALRRKMAAALVLTVIFVFGSFIGICVLGMTASGKLFPDVSR